MNVPVLDLKRQYVTIKDEIDAAILDVVASVQFILGPHVKAFEDAAADYCGVKHAIGVASGTDALLLSLKALDIGPGDGVILPSFTFFATAGVIHNAGATPVFCDIDPKTFNLDPAHLRHILSRYPTNPTNSTNSMNPTIRALIPVHLYGQIADMNEINAIAEEFGLAVVEDAAQAIGATYSEPRITDHGPRTMDHTPRTMDHEPGPSARAGTLGDLGCFSFFPTKNLGAYGDGGMIITDNDALADKLRMLRVHGSRPKYYHRMVGFNSRLDAIQAAILSVKLRHLDEWSTARGEVADRYDEELSGIEGIVIPFRAERRSHIFHQYTIRVLDGRRDELRDALKEQGIGTAIYYPLPLHLQECFENLGCKEGELPVSEKASREVLSLPVFPELTEEEQQSVVKAIKAFMER